MFTTSSSSSRVKGLIYSVISRQVPAPAQLQLPSSSLAQLSGDQVDGDGWVTGLQWGKNCSVNRTKHSPLGPAGAQDCRGQGGCVLRAEGRF